MFLHFLANDLTLKIVDYSLASILLLVIFVFLFYHIRKKFVIITYSALFVCYVVSLCLGMNVFSGLSLVAILIFSFACVLVNASEFRTTLSNFSFIKKKIFSKKKKTDNADVNRIIEATVRDFSKTKTGAIIIFQKEKPLTDGITDEGVLVNAPLTMEMLQTIFYKGTRLHDGAVIVKDSTIVSAAVMLVATSRPLNGKYGTRHRAAIGISESSDAVVICVSEETGRISLAHKGKLEYVSPDRFIDEFIDLMNRE